MLIQKECFYFKTKNPDENSSGFVLDVGNEGLEIPT